MTSTVFATDAADAMDAPVSAPDSHNEPGAIDAAANARPVLAAAHLVFVPERDTPHWFLWGSEAAQSALAVQGEPGSMWLPDETQQTLRLRRIRGYRLPLLDGAMQLASLSQGELLGLPLSVSVWSLAAKLALELVSRQQLVPRVLKTGGRQVACWQVSLNLAHDRERVSQLLLAFPIAAHAVPVTPPTVQERQGADLAVWSAPALLQTFMDMLADQLVRAAQPRVRKRKATATPADGSWPLRWQQALLGEDAEFIPAGAQERTVLTDLRDWLQPVVQAAQLSWHLCLQLIPPEATSQDFVLRFALQRSDDDSMVTAQELFNDSTYAVRLADERRIAQQQLLQQLAVAARSFGLIEQELRKPHPLQMVMRPRVICEFIKQITALEQSGIRVLIPDELRPELQQRVQMVMRLGATQETKEAAQSATRHMVPYTWRARLAGYAVNYDELDALLELRTPLTKFKDRWVMLDSREILHAQQLLQQRGGEVSRSLALSLTLSGSQTQRESGLQVLIEPEGDMAHLVAQMREREAIRELPDPHGLRAQLRPYQRRGFSWLAHLASLGLGACLADDMGLGKTLQLLTYVLHRQAQNDERPMLLVCPTSVIGNWERELSRFAPTLAVMRHYGGERIQNVDDFALSAAGKLVLTSYGLLRRDIDWLKDVSFSLCVLDEAQFIKNSGAATARAARALQAQERIALTGTPVENHLTELWSIMEFLNPGLLGARETFRREIAIPVERYGREDMAEKLKRMVAPFILRRVKTDPTVISDLPDKLEHKVFCSLTREQASLYQQAVNEAMLDIEGADGMARRGRVLALLTALKQICNHPAHFLREQGPLAGRSGKLDRLTEMLEQVLVSGDRALIFTQYREMGERLARALTRLEGKHVPFLHGGVGRAARDEMVRRFQEDPRAAHLLVISLKAGGTGLNLTAATQVFHFDRWWNPAVEDQATDRAYRIGQQRNVQVYKLLCVGTVEDKIDQMLDAKRDLAERVVTQGEAWISELDNTQLRELFALAPNAVVGDAPDAEEDAP
jgi:superfamily II DNA or RNA helicase